MRRLANGRTSACGTIAAMAAESWRSYECAYSALRARSKVSSGDGGRLRYTTQPSTKPLTRARSLQAAVPAHRPQQG